MRTIDKAHLADIAHKHGLALVVLFGSQATGLTHQKSDIDIGYLSAREIDYHEAFKITESLIRVFKNRAVELVNLKNVSPALNKQVADDGLVLFEAQQGIFDRFVMRAQRLYMDTKPLREYQRRYIDHFIHAHA